MCKEQISAPSSATKAEHINKQDFVGTCHTPAFFRAFATELDEGAKKKLIKLTGSMEVGRTAGSFRIQD